MNPNAKLEHFEWVNIWHDHTNLTAEEESQSKRLLFIGDSITNGMRQFLPAMLREKYTECPLNVDFMVTSKGIDNPDILRELDYMMKDYNYDVVQFNNCLHGFSVNEQDYETYYEEVICHILEKVAPEKLCFMLGTPLSVKDKPDTYERQNERVCNRNEAVKRIAQKHGVAVNNLYSVVYGNTEIRALDGYHYNADGYEILAEACSDFIVEKLK